MANLYFYLLLSIIFNYSLAFIPKSHSIKILNLNALRRVAAGSAAPVISPGENIPKEIACQNAIYDMILVERCSMPEKTTGGLFIPQIEGKDNKHVGLVLSVPKEYGLESEQGRVQPINDIAPYKVGDYVFIQDPWGIGPKDQKIGDRMFSFHKAAHILAVMRK